MNDIIESFNFDGCTKTIWIKNHTYKKIFEQFLRKNKKNCKTIIVPRDVGIDDIYELYKTNKYYIMYVAQKFEKLEKTNLYQKPDVGTYEMIIESRKWTEKEFKVQVWQDYYQKFKVLDIDDNSIKYFIKRRSLPDYLLWENDIPRNWGNKYDLPKYDKMYFKIIE